MLGHPCGVSTAKRGFEFEPSVLPLGSGTARRVGQDLGGRLVPISGSCERWNESRQFSWAIGHNSAARHGGWAACHVLPGRLGSVESLRTAGLQRAIDTNVTPKEEISLRARSTGLDLFGAPIERRAERRVVLREFESIFGLFRASEARSAALSLSRRKSEQDISGLDVATHDAAAEAHLVAEATCRMIETTVAQRAAISVGIPAWVFAEDNLGRLGRFYGTPTKRIAQCWEDERGGRLGFARKRGCNVHQGQTDCGAPLNATRRQSESCRRGDSALTSRGGGASR